MTGTSASITIPLTTAAAIRRQRCILESPAGEHTFHEIVANGVSIRFTNTEGAAEIIERCLRELAGLGVIVTIHNPDGSTVSLKHVG